MAHHVGRNARRWNRKRAAMHHRALKLSKALGREVDVSRQLRGHGTGGSVQDFNARTERLVRENSSRNSSYGYYVQTRR